jgi:hypothetical protein
MVSSGLRRSKLNTWCKKAGLGDEKGARPKQLTTKNKTKLELGNKND